MRASYISVWAVLSVLFILPFHIWIMVDIARLRGYVEATQEILPEVGGHGMVLHDSATTVDPGPIIEKIRRVREVTGATPVVVGEALVRHQGRQLSVFFQGHDPRTAGEVVGLEPTLEKSSFKALSRPSAQEGGDSLPRLFLGKEAAARLAASPGDVVEVIGLRANGAAASAMRFKVADVFRTHFCEYDLHNMYTSIDAGRELLGQPDSRGAFVMYRVERVEDVNWITANIRAALQGDQVTVMCWEELSARLLNVEYEGSVRNLVKSALLLVVCAALFGFFIFLHLRCLFRGQGEDGGQVQLAGVVSSPGPPCGGARGMKRWARFRWALKRALLLAVSTAALGALAGFLACVVFDAIGIEEDMDICLIDVTRFVIPPGAVFTYFVAFATTLSLGTLLPSLLASRPGR